MGIQSPLFITKPKGSEEKIEKRAAVKMTSLNIDLTIM